MAQILNKTIVRMVPYCAQQPFGWKQKQLKVDSNELKVKGFQLKNHSYQQISLKLKRKIN